MEPTPPPQSSSDAASPLLFRRLRRRVLRRGGPIPLHCNSAARFLRRPLTRRMMLSSPSFLVRENAVDQLEQRCNDWSYSKPVVALDVVLNLVLIGVALYAVVLSSLGAEEDDDDFALITVWVARKEQPGKRLNDCRNAIPKNS
ncbi:hypothetical protein MLD38_019757 [Melastoma candidum]|uniref:Uncharacterized protein n=1 Tax=Melastoma candidum TaxID=119954 RepID=A0ACB9QX67_9MYRT|nr:hypothetical protein MLD38_019757 [Melastoma candidum]